MMTTTSPFPFPRAVVPQHHRTLSLSSPIGHGGHSDVIIVPGGFLALRC
jgi:hypothetical protein